MKRQALASVLTVAFSSTFFLSEYASAQTLEEVVVTAQKRAENIQDVPISISALSGKMLTEAKIDDVGDLPKLVPTLRWGVSPGTVGPKLTIRGLGSFGNSAIEPSVATFVDGFYVPRNAAVVTTFLDMDAVEVLGGPQGTLFGRNASVGLIHFKSAIPRDEPSSRAAMEVDSDERYRVEGMINAPISERISIRFAGLAELFDGYWKNDLDGKNYGGVDTYAGRLTLRAELPNDMTWLVRGDYSKMKGDGAANVEPRGFTPGSLARYTAINDGIAPDLDPFDDRNNMWADEYDVDDSHWGVSSDLSWEAGTGYTFRLLNGYRHWDADESDGDISWLSVPVFGRDVQWESKSHSHELQLISPKGLSLLGRRFDYVAGLYYFEEDLAINYKSNFLERFCEIVLPAPLVSACQAAPQRAVVDALSLQDTTSIAAYGQGTFGLTDTLDVTFGARWTRDKKDGRYIGVRANPFAASLGTNENTILGYKDETPTWRATVTWRLQDDVMLFTTYSTGYKSGGFENASNPIVLGRARLFASEKTDNYELGIKSTTLDGALRVNATLYRMDVTGLQERAQDGSGVSRIRNVGELRHHGVELDSAYRLTDHLEARLGVAWLDSEFTDYPAAPRPPYLGGGVQDLAGARLTYTPEWSGNIGVTVDGNVGRTGLRWALAGNLSFVSEFDASPVNDKSPLNLQEGYALLGARLTLYGREDKWSVALFGDNLTDKGYCDATGYQILEGPLGLRYPGGTPTICFPGRLRTVGVRAAIEF